MLRGTVRILSAVLAAAALAAPGAARGDVAETRLLQRHIEDAPRIQPGWLEAGFRFQDFDAASATILGVRGTAQAGERFEIGASLGHASVDPDGGGGGTDGLFDPEVFMRYLFEPTINAAGQRSQIALGAAMSLPLGDEELLQGTFDVEGFVALRHYLESLALMGALGFRVNGNPEIEIAEGDAVTFVEIPAETSFFVGGALLVPITERATFTAEIDVETKRLEGDDSDVRLTPGVDARMGERVHLRGGVGIGLADGSPDLEVLLGLSADL